MNAVRYKRLKAEVDAAEEGLRVKCAMGTHVASRERRYVHRLRRQLEGVDALQMARDSRAERDWL